jgi:hypothetical protein
MLTDELTSALQRHADTVMVDGRDVRNRLETERSRRRRQHAAVGLAVVAVLAVTGATGWAARSTHGQDGSRQSAPLLSTAHHGAGSSQIPVRCDTPSQPIAHYLDWPCMTSIDATGSALLNTLVEDGQANLAQPKKPLPGTSITTPNEPVKMRLLAYGPLTGPLGTYAVAEFWSPRYPFADIETYVNAGPGRSGGLGGSARSVRPLYNTNDVQADRGIAETVCADTSPSHETAAPQCTDIFLTRADVTLLRLLRPGLPPLTVPARNGFAELPATSINPVHHRDWQVQALDARHVVIASIAYPVTF